jgi:hypothetical protein
VKLDAEIQSDWFYDYRTNVPAYPKWQASMREAQPRLLVIWGRYELSFDSGEPERFRRDASSKRSPSGKARTSARSRRTEAVIGQV